MKKLLLLLLTLSLVFALFSCGGCKHADTDGDGICDECEEKLEIKVKNIPLIDKAGLPTFKFVLASGIDTKAKATIQAAVSDLKDVDIEIDVVYENSENTTETEYEVLVGGVTTRGTKYYIDGHTLGNKGYVVKIMDNKIIINGGSGDALNKAVTAFIEDILGFDGDEIWDVTMTVDAQIDEAQKDYGITSLKLLGEDMRGYTIATNLSSAPHLTAAKSLQDIIYRQTGYWFDFVELDKADKSIVIKTVDRVYGEDSFKITAKDGQLLIESAFDNKLADATAAFVAATFIGKEGEINFEGNVYNKDISYVTYEEFGATNNGKKDDDFKAIYEAHQFANAGGQTIKILGNPTYCIKRNESVKGTAKPVSIMTDTDWGNMTLYIDDTAIDISAKGYERDLFTTNVFNVLPSEEMQTLSGNQIPQGLVINTKLYKDGNLKINLNLGRAAIVVPYYEGHRVYRRKGYGAASGNPMHEVIVVDANGNISDETPIMWDYAAISYIYVYYLDEQPLTVEGGTIKTIANSQSIYGPNYDKNTQSDYHNVYISRGILIERANTTIKNVKHYVEGEITLKEHSEELKTGAAYRGFFHAQNTTNVTLKDCVLTGHRCYTKPKSLGGGGTQGTYDFYADCVNKIVLDGCKQSNFWVTVDKNGIITPHEEHVPGAVSSMAREQVFKNGDVSNNPDIWGALMHWGVGGTNYCKNMEYLNCKLSRFDAHAGLYNGKVINSEVNVLALTGMGDFEIKDSKIYVLASDSTYNNLLHLRSDYGSTWAGEIKMTNFDAYVYADYVYTQDSDSKKVTHDPFIVMHTYTNWYYGYEATYPSLEFNGVKFYDADRFYKTGEENLLMGLEIEINSGTHIKYIPDLNEKTLSEDSLKIKSPNFCYTDEDGDGFVDAYRDENGNMVQFVDADGNKIPYNKAEAGEHSNGIKNTPAEHLKNVNLNPVKPPDYVKVLNNDGYFKLLVTDTSFANNGGFFGETKFYYAPDKYYTGTGEAKADDDNVFVFH